MIRTKPFKKVAEEKGWSLSYTKKVYSILGITSIQQIKRQLIVKDGLRSEPRSICEYLRECYGVRISERALEICRLRLIKKGLLPDPQLKLFEDAQRLPEQG